MTVFSKSAPIGAKFGIVKNHVRLAAVAVTFASLAVVPLQAKADFFKCKDANGKFSYQQVPCEKNAEQQQLRSGSKRLVTIAGDQKPKRQNEPQRKEATP